MLLLATQFFTYLHRDYLPKGTPNMAFFPSRVLPKSLRKETSNEVDNSPLIYNARDYNIHHREIRSIEESLLGASSGGGIINLVSTVNDLMSDILNGGLLAQYCGTIQAGGQISIPSKVTNTKTVGAVGSSDSTINVSSTEGFPDSGVLTKFNGLGVQEWCTNNIAPSGGACSVGAIKFLEYDKFHGGATQRTFQETITYTSKTDTAFLNCTRGVNSTTAEAVSSAEQSVIILGNAALWLAPNVWVRDTTKFQNQFYITYTPDLTVNAHLLEQGSRTVVKPNIDILTEINWGLSVVSYFSLPNIDQAFGASPQAGSKSFGPQVSPDRLSASGNVVSGGVQGYMQVKMQDLSLPNISTSFSFAGKAVNGTLGQYGIADMTEGTIYVYKISDGEYGVSFDLSLGDLTSYVTQYGYSPTKDAFMMSIPIQISIGSNGFLAYVNVQTNGNGKFGSLGA